MYTVKSELPADRKTRQKENKTRTTDYGKRYKRILEKRRERALRVASGKY